MFCRRVRRSSIVTCQTRRWCLVVSWHSSQTDPPAVCVISRRHLRTEHYFFLGNIQLPEETEAQLIYRTKYTYNNTNHATTLSQPLILVLSSLADKKKEKKHKKNDRKISKKKKKQKKNSNANHTAPSTIMRCPSLLKLQRDVTGAAFYLCVHEEATVAFRKPLAEITRPKTRRSHEIGHSLSHYQILRRKVW